MAASNFPIGNAFIFNTPHLDQATNFLMRDEQLRRQQADRENFMLDQQMNKEFANVRSADSEDVINSYNQYKQIKKQLYQNKDLQRDPKLYNRVQQAANEALANTYQTINRSVELKKQGELLVNERKVHPEKFADDFGERVTTFNQTPLSQLSQHPVYGDLSNPDNYRYKGSLTNFQPLLQKATGTPRDLGSPVETVEPGGLQRRISSFKGTNSPYEFYNQLVGSLVGSSAPRDFVGTFGDITPEQEQIITEQYNRLKSDPKFKAAYGISDNQDFPVSAYQTQTGRIAKILAMQHAINNPISEKVEFKPITNAVEDLRQKNRLILEGVKQGNRESLIALRHNYKQADKKAQAALENDYWNTLEDDAKKNPRTVFEKGKTYTQYEMKSSPEADTILSPSKDKEGNYQQLDAIRMNPDDTVEGIIYKRDDKGKIEKDDKGHNIIETTSRKLLKSDFRVRLVKSVFGVKEAKAEQGKIEDEVDDNVAPPAPVAKPSLKKGMFD